ncbi:unnamed protein product [Gongylonema pulchrum]|uniref:Uncharacterized protein n=1 Tax=Gongylonema pulchrum TaxID=637853 RepID=A0A183ECV7_9BILA|nr:unnamed protein product [Gongylonema pulchrum]
MSSEGLSSTATLNGGSTVAAVSAITQIAVPKTRSREAVDAFLLSYSFTIAPLRICAAVVQQCKIELTKVVLNAVLFCPTESWLGESVKKHGQT